MASFNRVIIIGNLTRDPEYKQLASGQAVCRLGIATNRQFKNKQSGTMVQEVCYIDADVWGAQAESCRQYLQKGRPVLVEGRIKYDTWEDANGQTRSKHSIVADRVVFLASNQAAESIGDEKEFGSSEAAAPTGLEKDLLDQIEQIKSKNRSSFATKAADEAAPKKKKAKESEAPAEGAFQDEPPFQDDLPF